MEKVKVGVKYCGHCNPYSDGPAIIKATEALATGLEFVSWGDDEKKVLLIISGCLNDCVSKPAFDGPVVHIANNTLNGKQWTADELPGVIVTTIMSLLERTVL